MDTIKDIIYSVMGKIEKGAPSQDNKIERIWNNCLNDQEKKHMYLIGIKDGILSVAVDSSMWLYQMNIQKTKILTLLQQEIPQVKNIRFKIGKKT